MVKLQLNYCNAPRQLSEFTISSCSERTRDVHSSSLLIDVYALFSDVSLRRQASILDCEKFPDPFCSKSDVNLFNHLVRKADVAGCCSAKVLFFVDIEVAPCSVSLIYVSEVVFTLS